MGPTVIKNSPSAEEIVKQQFAVVTNVKLYLHETEVEADCRAEEFDSALVDYSAGKVVVMSERKLREFAKYTLTSNLGRSIGAFTKAWLKQQGVE